MKCLQSTLPNDIAKFCCTIRKNLSNGFFPNFFLRALWKIRMTLVLMSVKLHGVQKFRGNRFKDDEETEEWLWWFGQQTRHEYYNGCFLIGLHGDRVTLKYRYGSRFVRVIRKYHTGPGFFEPPQHIRSVLFFQAIACPSLVSGEPSSKLQCFVELMMAARRTRCYTSASAATVLT